MSSRADPMAADPDSPGRQVARAPLHRGAAPPVQDSPLQTERTGSAGELESEAMALLGEAQAQLEGARVLIHEATTRTSNGFDRRELRKVSDRITWLLLWTGRRALEAKRAELIKEREKIEAQLAAIS